MQLKQGSSTINQIFPILVVPVNPSNTNNNTNENRDSETYPIILRRKKHTSTQTYNSEFLEDSSVKFYAGLPSMACRVANSRGTSDRKDSNFQNLI